MLMDHIAPFLPQSGVIADVGSGTGHNAMELRKRSACEVRQFDISDIHWVGETPELLTAISSDDDPFDADCVLLIYVLQYPERPSELLGLIRNSRANCMIVLQSTFHRRWGRWYFRFQEAIWGPVAFHLAKLAGLVTAKICPVKPRRYFRPQDVTELLLQNGFQVDRMHPEFHPITACGSTLFVCRKVGP